MSMPYAVTIKDEARFLLNTSSDLDNFRRLYSLIEDNDESILVKFVAPKIVAFDDYRFYLLKNSNKKLLQPNFYYRPDYVSYQEYDTINLWPLLLFINDIPTIEDFIKEEILIPTRAAIAEMTRNIAAKDLLTEVVNLKDIPLQPTPALFMRKKNVPYYHDPATVTPAFTPTDLYFNKEIFTVDVVMSRARYVDLQYEAVANSVVLNVKDKPNYIYGKHYSLIKGKKGLNRVTWDPRYITNGIGLVSIMIEGVSFEIDYARKVVTI